MSDMRVAVVAEGPTDVVIIEAALKALLIYPFTITQLQPEHTRPALGGGWGGVLRWCLDFSQRGHSSFEDDPTISAFDLLVVHIDADVSERDYADVSCEIERQAIQKGWPTLASSMPCPPPCPSVEKMRACLIAWSGIQSPGPRTVLCVPSKAIESWLVAALFDDNHRLMTGLECNLVIARQLADLPRPQRVRKATREYQARADILSNKWDLVRKRCSLANRFSVEVASVLGSQC